MTNYQLALMTVRIYVGIYYPIEPKSTLTHQTLATFKMNHQINLKLQN